MTAAPTATPLPRISATLEEVRAMLGCPSKWSALQELKYIGVKPYRRGKYRLADIQNAIARKTRQ